MTSRPLCICLLLFAAGAAGSWLWPARHSSSDSPQNRPAAETAGPFPTSSPAPALPEPSGLPGDLIHLSTITDTRTLRAAWETADNDTRAALVLRWIDLNPEDGIRFFLFELVNGAPRNLHDAGRILVAWSQQDPLAYLKYVGSLPGKFPPELSHHWRGFMEKQLISDPESLIAFWKTASPNLRNEMYPELFDHWFATDPAVALAEAEQAPVNWQEDIWEAAAAKAPDPAAMLRTLLEKQGAVRFPSAIQGLIGKLAETDLTAALQAATQLPPGKARKWACQEVVGKLAETDPEAAWAWMEAHAPTDENRREAAEALMKKDPLKAMAMDPDGTWWQSSGALLEYAGELAGKDWQAAADLAQSVGPTLRRQIILGMAASLSFGKGDPLPQLDQLSRLFMQSGLGSDIPTYYLFRELDPSLYPVVAAWLTNQPDAVRDLLIQPMVSRLLAKSPGTAAAWLAQLPSGQVRTEQLLQTTATWAGSDPQAAADFALTLPPGTDRDYAVLNTAIAWHRNAPAAARAWLDALPDSPSKTRALAELEPPGKQP